MNGVEVASDVIDLLFKHVYLIIELEPLERALPSLEAGTALTPAAARLVLQQLREFWLAVQLTPTTSWLRQKG